MSERQTLLLFVGADPGWMRMIEDRVVARGAGLETIPVGEAGDDPDRVILVVPGSDVAIHWIDMPGDLAPAQARAAARIMASELSAEPLETMHAAIGPRFEGEDERGLGLVADARMASWLAEIQALGFDPDSVLPEPLLLLPPEEGVATFEKSGLTNVRGHRRAFAAEPDIAGFLIAEDACAELTGQDIEAGLAEAIALAPVDLRQGAFAKKRRWTIDWAHIRRLAAMAGGILLVTLAIQLTLIARYSFAADSLEREAEARARDVIPGNVEIIDPDRQLRERLEQAGGGPGYGEIAGAVFVSVRETPDIELQSLVYVADNSVQLTAAAPGPAQLTALQQRMEQTGLLVTPGAVQASGGRQIGEFTVRAP